MKSLLLGFDCRWCSLEDAAQWNESRRARYLLKPLKGIPMSVDTVVLPSIFDFDNGNSSAQEFKLAPADFHQQALRLWRDFTEMHRRATSVIQVKTVTEIAICLSHSASPLEQWWHDFEREPVVPAALDSSWTSVGFDVADRHLTSVVSNCGFEQHEKEMLVKTWAGSLNSVGLFGDQRHATAFGKFFEDKVPAHSPLFVFEILSKTR